MNCFRSKILPHFNSFLRIRKKVIHTRGSQTRSKYSQNSKIGRRNDLGAINDFVVSHFERIFGHLTDDRHGILTNLEDIEPFNVDITGKFRGSSGLVLQPSTTDQLVDAVKLCNNWKLGVLPQGGNTSLVGSSSPTFDEVIMSTRRMNKIISIDPDTGTVVCEAGVIPADLELALLDSAYDLSLPLDLGSWDISCIGGNISTNARGIRTLRCPDFRYSIIGLEVVLPNGEVLNVLDGSNRDLVGLDVKQCFIGTEGIFGVITKAAIRCLPRSKSTEVALITCNDYGSVMDVMRLARRDLADTLSAFEYMDHGALTVVERELNLRLPMAEGNSTGSKINKKHAIFMEISSATSDSQAMTLMDTFTSKVRSLGLCNSSVISRNEKDIEKLWRCRKAVINACKEAGIMFKFDLKVSARRLPELFRIFDSVNSADNRLLTSDDGAIHQNSGNEARIKDIVIFGQLPTGNIHVVVTIDPETWKIEQMTSSEVQAHGVPACVKRLELALCFWLRMGNPTTEGGFLAVLKDSDGKWMRWINRPETDQVFAERNLQLALKKAWDPKGIMNPYKTWPVDQI